MIRRAVAPVDHGGVIVRTAVGQAVGEGSDFAAVLLAGIVVIRAGVELAETIGGADVQLAALERRDTRGASSISIVKDSDCFGSMSA